MAAKSRSFASRMSNWKMALGGYEKHSAELDFCSNEAANLRTAVTEAEALNVRQEQLKADLAKTTEELKTKLEAGEKLHASIIRFASGKYGPKSKEMKDFKATGEM